jgi:hypothetical protein
MDLREIGGDGLDWVDVAQDRDQWRALVSTVLNRREFLEWLRNCQLLKKGSAP